MRQRFADWYAEQIRAGSEKGLELESVKVKMTLTPMKPLHVRWLIKLFNIMATNHGKKVIISEWELSGISEAIKIALFKIPSLNPSKDSLMGEENVKFVTNQSFPEKEDPNDNDRELHDDGEEYE